MKVNFTGNLSNFLHSLLNFLENLTESLSSDVVGCLGIVALGCFYVVVITTFKSGGF